MDLLLSLALRLHGRLVLGETAAELTGELGAEVKRKVLLVLVEETELGSLLGVDDGQDTGNRLADVVAARYPMLVLLPDYPSSVLSCFQSIG